MVLDKFGRSSKIAGCKRSHQSTLTFGYVLTPEGDIDVQRKRLCNIRLVPSLEHEATSKQYVDASADAIKEEMRIQLYKLRGLVTTVSKQIEKINIKLSDATSNFTALFDIVQGLGEKLSETETRLLKFGEPKTITTTTTT